MNHSDINIHFVVGCPRSGTTLLSTLIGRHSMVAATPETHFVDQLLPKKHDVLEKSHEYVWKSIDHSTYLKDFNLREKEVKELFDSQDATFRDLFTSYLTAYTKKIQKPIVLEKTPDHIYHFDLLKEWYPKSKFIIIIRDGRAVSHSLSKTYWGNIDPKKNIPIWSDSIRQTLRLVKAKHPNSIYIIKFEDLVLNPQIELEKVMMFLGVNFEITQLDNTIKVPNIGIEEHAWKDNASKEISSSKLTEFRSEMSSEDYGFCSSNAAYYLKKFNYPVSLKDYFSYANLKTIFTYKINIRYRIKTVYHLVFHSNQTVQFKILPTTVLNTLRPQIIDRDELLYKISTTNCGITRYNNEYIGIFKNGTFHYFSYEIGILLPRLKTYQVPYLCTFNHEFMVTSLIRLKVFIDGKENTDVRNLIEDVRLITYDNNIYTTLVYIPDNNQNNSQVLICKLDLLNNKLDCFKPKISFAGPPQKNWVPFVYNNKFYLQYDINPAIIIEYNLSRMKQTMVYKTQSLTTSIKYYGLRLSGGTPLVQINNNTLLGLCHAYKSENGLRNYFSFFYSLDPTRNFKLERMSEPLKITTNDRVQFAIGLVYNKNELIISYGIADCDNFFVKLQIQDVFNLLQKTHF